MSGTDRTLADGGKVAVIDRGHYREIRLRRPEVHNALDEDLIAALEAAFIQIGREVSGRADGPRGVLLSAEGRSFCAGADLEYMRRVGSYSEEENLSDARRVSDMFKAVRFCPAFVLARVHGNALGGGVGLAACCDFVLAAEGARFGFTEVRLGIVPAVISPFVIERIGAARARATFPTGEVFTAVQALQMGLVDRVVPVQEIDAAAERIMEGLRDAAPNASREAKKLANEVASRLPLRPDERAGPETVFEDTARFIARLRAMPEAREGMSAFLEKRKPRWTA